jgi:glycosyltransferase involved in cell wall biosynthesis
VKDPQKPRIFVGLVEVAGYFAGVVQGLRELGVRVSHVNTFENPYYPCPSANGSRFIAASNALTKLFHAAHGNRVSRWLFKPIRWLHLIALFLWAILRHDVFIFAFGESFFSLRELPVYRPLGKKLIFVFSGSDTRPPYLSGLYISDPEIPLSTLIAISADAKAKVLRIEKYADCCINHALSAQFHEKPFVNFLRMGNPGQLDTARSMLTSGDVSKGTNIPARVRILHAPSRPLLKGSALFNQLIERLRAEGIVIDYVELRKRPHREVLEELANCDFVIDELYSDMPLAGLGTEAASFGKPALVGGYGARALREASCGLSVPFETYCNPVEIEKTLRRLIIDRDWRLACGQNARIFVLENWQPLMLAERFLAIVSGHVPRDWMFDPQQISYYHGWGVSEERLRRRLAALIEFAGIEALRLTDKPQLERAILDFALNAESSCAPATVQ